jgi:hypothetical protein
MTTGLNGRWPGARSLLALAVPSTFQGGYRGRFNFSYWTLVCIRTKVAECPNRSHKKSDADFRKELINADMGVFNKIAKRQTAARKYKTEKNVTPSARARPR